MPVIDKRESYVLNVNGHPIYYGTFKRGFLDGIDKLAEFGIIAFQVRMTGHARAWRDEVSVHLATVPVLTQAADQQEVSS
jgi:hypothetical protein